jgi:hypothetical protein
MAFGGHPRGLHSGLQPWAPTSQWPKVTSTHRALHSGLQPWAPTSQWPKVTSTHKALHSGLRLAPTRDFTMAFGHGHPLVLYIKATSLSVYLSV